VNEGVRIFFVGFLPYAMQLWVQGERNGASSAEKEIVVTVRRMLVVQKLDAPTTLPLDWTRTSS
jgi:hypothetical protein